MRVQKKSPFKPRAKAGSYKIENKKDETSIYLYDEIGWFGIDAEKFVKDLKAIESKEVSIHINSPGGSVFDGTAIFNAIKQHKSKTISYIDGLAASISSVIALASDEVRMAENAFLMIHDPYSMVIGNADTMREEANLLDKIGGVIAKTYADKTGKDGEEIDSMMAAETWMTAEEALEAGFIDLIIKEEKEAKAKVFFDLSVFANVPEVLLAKKEPSVKDMEKALRDVGCSQKQAKTIIARGFDGYQRDVDNPENFDSENEEVQRDVEPSNQRDVDRPKPKKDRTAALLTRAEMIAKSI